jgi:hypothetical protein
LLLALRGQRGQSVAIRRRQAEQRRDQRHRAVELIGATRQQRLELIEPRLGRIVALEASSALQLLDHRMQRAGRVVR